MEVLAIAGTPVLGWTVCQLLTKVVAIFRQLKDRDKNVCALRDLLEYLEPWVKQLSSVPDVQEHAGQWWMDLHDLLIEAEALVQSSGRRVHMDSTKNEAEAQPLDAKVHEGSTQAKALAQSPGRQFHKASKSEKFLQSWTTSKKALHLCKRIQHLLDVGPMFYFACRANIDQILLQNADKILDKNEKMQERVELLLPLRECGAPEEKICFGGDAIFGEVCGNLLKGDDKWVGLWGMGGIGKMFTASNIYHDLEIKQRYADNIYWVTVSKDQADPAHFCNLLMDRIGACHQSLEDVKSYLRETFKERRVLLILDDVWEGEPGEEKILQHLDMVSDNTNSVIFVTTREKRIFPQRCKHKLFTILTLSSEDSWELFSWHAFGRHGRAVPHDLENVAREVASECKGLPLAFEVIGSTMAGKEVSTDEEEFFDIQPRDIWDRALNDLKDASKEENS